jgi:endonuclease/exonuclease/phosphatase family metal-dependent hydrolase
VISIAAMRLGLVALLLLGACDLVRDHPGPEALDAGGYAPPRTDVVPAVGGADTLDLGAWNIEYMPKSDRTVRDVADLIASLALDVVVVEEVASIDAWDELVARLPEYGAVLSSHRYTATSYQKIGVLYRTELVTASEPELLFVEQGYDFPRPPMLVHLTIAGAFTLDVVRLHLKPGVAPEDVQRRAAAVATLDAWMRARVDGGVDDDELVVLGDWNATLDPSRDDLAATWPPIVDAPERYTIRTAGAAGTSYLPFGTTIDHIVTTAGLADEIGDRDAVIVPLGAEYPGYEDLVSDHQPVALSFPMPAAE